MPAGPWSWALVAGPDAHLKGQLWPGSWSCIRRVRTGCLPLRTSPAPTLPMEWDTEGHPGLLGLPVEPVTVPGQEPGSTLCPLAP